MLTRTDKWVVAAAVVVAVMLWVSVAVSYRAGRMRREASRSLVDAGYAQANILSQPLPVYPSALKARGVEGLVAVHAVIARDGTIASVQAESGPDELKPVAINAIRHWRYKPNKMWGEPHQVETEMAILFTLGSVDYKAMVESGVPVVTVVSATMPLVPPKHPGALRTGKPAIPDTLAGIQMQTQEVFDAFRRHDQRKIDQLLEGFAMPDPSAWLKSTFGEEKGGEAEPQYEMSFARFEKHMRGVGDAWANAPNAALHVEDSKVPMPPEEAGAPDGPPNPAKPLRIENFRFFITTGEIDPGDWVFSFVYLDGAFRIVGGTHTFWNEHWRHNVDAVTLWTGNSDWHAIIQF